MSLVSKSKRQLWNSAPQFGFGIWQLVLESKASFGIQQAGLILESLGTVLSPVFESKRQFENSEPRPGLGIWRLVLESEANLGIHSASLFLESTSESWNLVPTLGLGIPSLVLESM